MLLLLVLVATPAGRLFGSSDRTPPADLGIDVDSAATPAVPSPMTALTLPTPGSAPLTGAVPVEIGYAFVWPASGPITSYMTPEHPTGIDIGMREGEDSPVVAMAAGTVTFAGGTTTEDYGYHVIIDHGLGLSTVYGHFSKVLVTAGQTVNQGDLLGLGGSTGKADGKHLHFEVHFSDGLLDPLSVLPPTDQRSQTSSIDCATAGLQIDQGSHAHLDFSSFLGSGARLTAAVIEPVSQGMPPGRVAAAIAGDSAVDLTSVAFLADHTEQDDYLLHVTYRRDIALVDDSFDCPVRVQIRNIPPTYFAPLDPAQAIQAARLNDAPALTPSTATGTAATTASTSAVMPPPTATVDSAEALRELADAQLGAVNALLRAATATPSPTPKPPATATGTSTPTNTPTPRPLPTNTLVPTFTPTRTAVPATATPTRTPTPAPVGTTKAQ